MIKGKTTIAPDVLTTIARMTTLTIDGVSRLADDTPNVNRIFRRNTSSGVEIELQDDAVFANLYVILKNGVNIREVSRNIQHHVSRAIAEMVGMQVGRVNVHIVDIDDLEVTEA
jgi:uncharacterized alkaline shock family protein YloU